MRQAFVLPWTMNVPNRQHFLQQIAEGTCKACCKTSYFQSLDVNAVELFWAEHPQNTP
jgi:hypothetical protein